MILVGMCEPVARVGSRMVVALPWMTGHWRRLEDP